MNRPSILPRAPRPSFTQLLLDVVVVAAGWAGVLVVSNITEEIKRSAARSLVMTIVGLGITILIMQRRGLYAGRPTLPRTEEISRVFVAVVGGASSIAVFAAFLDWHIGATELLVGGTAIFGVRTLIRGMLRTLASEIPGADRPEKVVIVGTGYEARELADLIIDHPETRFSLAGVVGNLSVAERCGVAEHWIGPTGRLIELMHQHEASGAIVTATGFRGEQFRAINSELFRSGYDVHLTTGVTRMGEGRFDVRSLSHEPLVVMERNPIRRSHLVAKRAIDIVFGSLALILASPLMLLTALAIWLEDRGPVTYTAVRAGRLGTFFRMYKFRSMVTNAEDLREEIEAENERKGPLFKMSNDPRITRVGRLIRETSIDELPQLINVVLGHMSLVGPRPALPEEEAEFDEELRDRFEVRPGITGLWQVEARSNASFNAYRRLDLHYVENWTIGLDLRILLATAEQVVVSVALLPLRRLRRAGSDGIEATPAETPATTRQTAGASGVAAADLATNSSTLATATTPASTNGATVHADENGATVNGAAVRNGEVVIDLRDRSRAKLAAAEVESAVADTGE